MDVKQKAHPLLLALVKVQRNHKKNYSWPSQLKLLELMDIYQGIKKSKATLNRWLSEIEGDKYLIRRRRIKNDPVRGHIFKSTLYKITIKGYRVLSRFGVDMRKEIAQYEKWLEEINPDHQLIKTRKMLQESKRNSRHGEYMRNIIDNLDKLRVVS